MVSHRAVLRLVLGTDFLQLAPGDRVAQAANASFDAATFEVWGPLLNGGTLAIIPQEVVLSPAALAAELRRHGVRKMFLTTALLNQMAREAPGAFAPLDDVLFGGEAVDPGAVRAVLRDGPPRRLLHVYGPTESTTFSTWFEIGALAEEATTVPIGRPIANTRAYVLDDHLQPVPVGARGSLYLGGAGLARGYLGRPGLTAERFVPAPFGAEAGLAPGERLYATGDLVRRLADGDIEFLGRADQQVKIRGFRIEPAEIEAALAGHPAVGEAAVLALADGSGGKRLVAYAAVSGAAPPAAEMRDYLRAKLPDYMVPSVFVWLESLPLTPNGKVDRKALARHEVKAEAAERVAPRTEVEEALADVFRQVFGLETVGVHDDFFALGGHSLLATQVVSRVRRLLGIDLEIRVLFEEPTIEQLARHIELAGYRGRGSRRPAWRERRRFRSRELLLASAHAARRADGGDLGRGAGPRPGGPPRQLLGPGRPFGARRRGPGARRATPSESSCRREPFTNHRPSPPSRRRSARPSWRTRRATWNRSAWGKREQAERRRHLSIVALPAGHAPVPPAVRLYVGGLFRPVRGHPGRACRPRGLAAGVAADPRPAPRAAHPVPLGAAGPAVADRAPGRRDPLAGARLERAAGGGAAGAARRLPARGRGRGVRPPQAPPDAGLHDPLVGRRLEARLELQPHHRRRLVDGDPPLRGARRLPGFLARRGAAAAAGRAPTAPTSTGSSARTSPGPRRSGGGRWPASRPPRRCRSTAPAPAARWPAGRPTTRAWSLGEEAVRRLQELARRHEITLNTLLQGAWGLLLRRLTGRDDLLFGGVVSGRPPAVEGIDGIVGMFINALPVRLRIDPERRLGDWLKELQIQQIDQREYEYVPFEQIQAWSEIEHGTRVFETLLVFENYPVSGLEGSGELGFEIRESVLTEANNHAMTLFGSPNKGGLELQDLLPLDPRLGGFRPPPAGGPGRPARRHGRRARRAAGGAGGPLAGGAAGAAGGRDRPASRRERGLRPSPGRRGGGPRAGGGRGGAGGPAPDLRRAGGARLAAGAAPAAAGGRGGVDRRPRRRALARDAGRHARRAEGRRRLPAARSQLSARADGADAGGFRGARAAHAGAAGRAPAGDRGARRAASTRTGRRSKPARHWRGTAPRSPRARPTSSTPPARPGRPKGVLVPHAALVELRPGRGGGIRDRPGGPRPPVRLGQLRHQRRGDLPLPALAAAPWCCATTP